MDGWTAVEGAPYPLGINWIEEEKACNFALYSKHATGVTLLLFSAKDFTNPIYQLYLNPLRNKSGRVWHCRMPFDLLRGARYYAYRVEGPFDPASGHRFDSQKILFDPYARMIFFPPEFSRETARHPGSNNGKAPLGYLHANRVSFNWQGDRQPIHTHDTVIYELHVRGFTMRSNSGVRDDTRGTFAGLVEKIPYLQDLGVTVVELMPVYQYDPQEGNYWGYMPLNFFSPHHSYSKDPESCEQLNEFREMVTALHAAGIEVILDVVYNHTTEMDETGPTYCYRGIDNTTYYLLDDDRRRYRNDSATGNVLHCANRYVRKMVLDSMRYWVGEMHVDGFRFDLASLFTRKSDGTINLDDPPIISEISADPLFASIRLIGEVWDVSSYQLGRSFPGITWLQWNGKFRDDVRAFIRGDSGKVNALMARLYGSDDLFPDNIMDAYHPYQSVNFVTSHDGLCLYDLVSYDRKHNEANGHHNTDGTDDNLSWNCAWEGDEDVPEEVLVLRKRQIKNFCALLFLSNGTPMFCAGDEFMNTQSGNNNPYNQDNETTWLNWDLLEKNRDIFRFFKKMISFRKAHPSLGRSRFWREDVRWYGTGPEVDRSIQSHSLALCLHGASQKDNDLYVMINASDQDLEFRIQEGNEGEWRKAVDTSLSSPDDFPESGDDRILKKLICTVKSRSIVILIR
ncbi:MAG: glycogen-debranching protein [Nitrospirae bacterium]|nr:glycogen-debranching protein [Nitrospirota bacterium]